MSSATRARSRRDSIPQNAPRASRRSRLPLARSRAEARSPSRGAGAWLFSGEAESGRSSEHDWPRLRRGAGGDWRGAEGRDRARGAAGDGGGRRGGRRGAGREWGLDLLSLPLCAASPRPAGHQRRRRGAQGAAAARHRATRAAGCHRGGYGPGRTGRGGAVRCGAPRGCRLPGAVPRCCSLRLALR